MTYYQEVGLRSDAPPEQIRDTYHALARLLHPDQQTDPKLRALAELQMIRVNQIFAVLGDAEKRAAYDVSLGADPRRAEALSGFVLRFSPAPGQVRGTVVAGFALGVLAGFLGAWITIFAHGPDNVTGEQGSSLASRAALSASIPAGKRSSPDREAKALPLHRVQQAETAPEASVFANDPPRLPLGGSVGGSMDLPQPPRFLVEAPVEESAAKPAGEVFSGRPIPDTHSRMDLDGRSESLAGSWVWVRNERAEKTAGGYPPEYIELAVREAAGVVRGRYRARYRVGDRAISPAVQFEFEGSQGLYSWEGNGGAKGDLKLNLKSEFELEIHWVTTEAGTLPALTSGSATLVRRR